MERWLDDVACDLPDGLLAWSRGYATLAEAWEACPSGEWRLWLAAYLATTDEERRACARAAGHVARTTIERRGARDPILFLGLELAEKWATTRDQDERWHAVVDDLVGGVGVRDARLASLVHTAMWFSDFEACRGVDVAVRDLFAGVRELAGSREDEAAILDWLARDLREMLALPARTTDGS